MPWKDSKRKTMTMGTSSAERRRRKTDEGYDHFLLAGVVLLMGMGIIMVYSASSAVAMKRFGTGMYFLNRQILHVLVAVLALIACRHLPYTLFRHAAYPLLTMAFLLLFLLYLPGVGHTVGGAKRWLRAYGTSFQPSEFARLALIVYLAYSMSKKQERIREFTIGFLPHVLVLACLTGLILFQPDFGMVVIIGLLAWIMLFIGGVRLSYLIGGMLAVLPLGYYVLTQAGYRLDRLTSFMDPWQHQTDAGYQVVHSLMAFGSGGVLGAGVGNSYQKLFYLPEPHTDFILSVVGEELGLVGICLVVGLYLVLLWRGVLIAMRAQDPFGSFLASGVTIALGLQVVINAGVALGLVPPKGLTLPFMSYGGTSLVVNAVAMGILMNISAQPVTAAAPRLSPRAKQKEKRLFAMGR